MCPTYFTPSFPFLSPLIWKSLSRGTLNFLRLWVKKSRPGAINVSCLPHNTKLLCQQPFLWIKYKVITHFAGPLPWLLSFILDISFQCIESFFCKPCNSRDCKRFISHFTFFNVMIWVLKFVKLHAGWGCPNWFWHFFKSEQVAQFGCRGGGHLDNAQKKGCFFLGCLPFILVSPHCRYLSLLDDASLKGQNGINLNPSYVWSALSSNINAEPPVCFSLLFCPISWALWKYQSY